MPKKAKKQKIVYKEDAASKAAELEAFLFGGAKDPDSLFEREHDELEETVADLIHKASKGRGGLLDDTDLFFTDTRGQHGSDDDAVDDDDGEASPPPPRAAEARGAGARKGKAAAVVAAPSGSSASEDEDVVVEELAEGDEDSDEDASVAAVGGASGSDDDVGAVISANEQEDEEEKQGDEGGRLRSRQAQAEQAGPSGRGDARQSKQQGGRRQAVWSDPDDAGIEVDVAKNNRLRKLRLSDKQTTLKGGQFEAALRKQHQQLNPRTSWAAARQAKGADDDGDGGAEQLLARAGGLLDRGPGRRLPPGQLETTRLKDANQHEPCSAVVQAVQFHPNGQVLLTAGLDKKLRLFQVDGLRNPKLQSVHVDDMPIHAAAFAGGADGGACVVLTGRRPHFYVFDLGSARIERVLGPAGCSLKSLESFAVQPQGASVSGGGVLAFCGDAGAIPLVSLATRQWQANLKMSGTVRALAFTQDGNELLSTGSDGLVHVWDLRTRRCRLQFEDVGNIGSGPSSAYSLAVSPDGRWIASGSSAGVANVYSRQAIEDAAAAAGGSGAARVRVDPARELMNLTTNVDTLRFSPDSQMLAFASRMKKDALRVMHLPSLTVFANWPTSRSPLHYVHALDFSPGCGLLAIGNAKGRALLYRLHHYTEV